MSNVLCATCGAAIKARVFQDVIDHELVLRVHDQETQREMSEHTRKVRYMHLDNCVYPSGTRLMICDCPMCSAQWQRHDFAMAVRELHEVTL